MTNSPKQAERRAENSSPLLASFELHLKADGLDKQTVAHYTGATKQFIAFSHEVGLPALTGIRREHVELWLKSLYDRYAVASVRNRFVGLHIFFKWMVEEGEMRRDPMAKIKRPVLEETRKDVVPAMEIAKALAYLEKNKRYRDAALLAIFYDTGMRAAEVAEALTEHVDLETGTIHIPKTKNKRMRTVHLSPKAVRYLDRYWRQKRNAPIYMINGHRGKMTSNGIYQAVRAVFEELGMKARIGPHDLRHTSASHVAESGLLNDTQMMDLYGWSDGEMVRHYTAQAREKAAIEAHKRASPLERLPKPK